jgi:pyrroloquinoline quinone (PQQ) biosynthesis protein C
VELPKIPSVVGCKDELQEGRRPSNGLRGYVVDLWNYLKFLV